MAYRMNLLSMAPCVVSKSSASSRLHEQYPTLPTCTGLYSLPSVQMISSRPHGIDTPVMAFVSTATL